MSSKAIRINFLIEADVSRELHALVPAGQRSKVVNKAIKKELLRVKRQLTTEKILELRDKGPKIDSAEIVEALRADRTSGH